MCLVIPRQMIKWQAGGKPHIHLCIGISVGYPGFAAIRLINDGRPTDKRPADIRRISSDRNELCQLENSYKEVFNR